MWASGLISSLAEITCKARAIEPLYSWSDNKHHSRFQTKYSDTGVVTEFNVFHELTPGFHNTSAFVSADQAQLGRDGPVTIDCVEICMEDTGILDIPRIHLGQDSRLYVPKLCPTDVRRPLCLPGIYLYAIGPPIFSMTVAHYLSGIELDIFKIQK